LKSNENSIRFLSIALNKQTFVIIKSIIFSIVGQDIIFSLLMSQCVRKAEGRFDFQCFSKFASQRGIVKSLVVIMCLVVLYCKICISLFENIRIGAIKTGSGFCLAEFGIIGNGYFSFISTECKDEDEYDTRSYIDAAIDISNCFFRRMGTLDGNGGIICIVIDSLTLKVADTMFYKCKCSNAGGAIYFNSQSSEIVRVCASYCQAEGNNHFIYIKASQNSKLEYISTTVCSGAINSPGSHTIQLEGAPIIMNSMNSSNNIALEMPGFFINEVSLFNATFCSFSNNRAKYLSCIFFRKCIGTISFTNIAQNTGEIEMGAFIFMFDATSNVIFEYSLFQNNVGLLFQIQSGTLSLFHCIIYHEGTLSSGSMAFSDNNNTLSMIPTYQLQFYKSHYCYADNPLPNRTPNESPIQTPADSPQISPIETLSNTPDSTPNLTPECTPDLSPQETPESTPELTHKESPIETPLMTPVLSPQETPELTPELTHKESPIETPLITPEVTRQETPFSTPECTIELSPTFYPTPFETLKDTPCDTLMETVINTPENTPIETPIITLMNTPVQTPELSPVETLEQTPIQTLEFTPILTLIETPIETLSLTPTFGMTLVETPFKTAEQEKQSSSSVLLYIGSVTIIGGIVASLFIFNVFDLGFNPEAELSDIKETETKTESSPMSV